MGIVGTQLALLSVGLSCATTFLTSLSLSAIATNGKIKKAGNGDTPHLELTENPDILRHLSNHESRPRLVVGFAAEAENLRENAMAKLARKGCDWIVGNAVTTTDGGSVFGSDSNSAMLITGNDCENWPMMSKQALAERLVDRIEATFA